MLTAVKFEDIKPVLKEKLRSGIKTPYYKIEDSGQMIFVVTPGKNGKEFNKTLGYFNFYPGVQSYQCLYGQGIIVMQRNDEFGEAKEFKIVTINSGKHVFVPVGWGMCIINTGSSYLVVLRSSFLAEKFEQSEPIIKKGGFAYFVMEKKGEIGFEENPNYKLHPQIATE